MGSIKSGSIQSIGAFKAAINGRAQELTEELKEAGVDPRDIPNQVKIKLRQEFKLDG
jgi:Sec-independent protein translocase protein TatA